MRLVWRGSQWVPSSDTRRWAGKDEVSGEFVVCIVNLTLEARSSQENEAGIIAFR